MTAAARARRRRARKDVKPHIPKPTHLEVGDVVVHRGSITGRAIVREIFFVSAKPKHGGPRWRGRLAFPQNRESEIGPRGHAVEQCVDADRLHRIEQERLF